MSIALDRLRAVQRWGRPTGARRTAAGGRTETPARSKDVVQLNLQQSGAKYITVQCGADDAEIDFFGLLHAQRRLRGGPVALGRLQSRAVNSRLEIQSL